jgi:L-rhamnose-H+ transport protein
MVEHFWLGMMLVFLAGLLNGSFSLPMKYSRAWAWENIWIVYAVVALLALPWMLAFGLVPNLSAVYRSLGWQAFLYPALFGLLWGLAQMTFGLSINAIGMAVSFAIVSGLVCLTGSLIPIIAFHPTDLFRAAGLTILAGMPVLLGGLVLYAKAGTLRSKDQGSSPAGASRIGMSFKVGLVLAIFTGVFGSAWNLGFAFSGETLSHAVLHGATPVTATYAAWAVILSGGLLPNLLYPTYLLSRRGTWSSFRQGNSLKELGLGVAMAILWLSAIVTYGIGATYVGKFGTSLGFTLYIASTILASSGWGIATGEWKGTSSRTRKLLVLGVATVLVSVLILNLGGLCASSR